MVSIALLGTACVLASGILFRHRGYMPWLALIGTLFEIHWLFLTLLKRTLFISVPEEQFYLAGSVVMLVVWLTQVKSWSAPRVTRAGLLRDVNALILVMMVAASAWLVSSRNGWQANDWVSHGFYNGDTVTLVTLVQRSFAIDTLLHENPFFGNGPLEYPTLLHAGLASFFQQFGTGLDWIQFLPSLTLWQIFCTIPLFFLLWEVLFPEPSNLAIRWFGVRSRAAVTLLQTIIVGYVLSIAWDGYIYPQGHFFLTGIFLVLVCLAQMGYELVGVRQLLWVVPMMAVTILLMLANAVTGTAALALLIVWCALRATDRKRLVAERAAWLFVPVLFIAVFIAAKPGNGSFGQPSFSYTAAVDMVRLAPISLALIVGIFWYLGRQQLILTVSTALMGLAVITFFFSTRDIVVENASRFFYHAALAGFPLVLGPLLALFRFLRLRLHYNSLTAVERAAAYGCLAVATLFFLLPAGSSVLQSHVELMFKDELIVPHALKPALWWIEDETAPNSIFITSLTRPWAIPFFTGRSLLRTDYWLSPEDEVTNGVRAAFTGDKQAQSVIVAKADYLVIQESEAASWGPIDLPAVFKSPIVTIYQTKAN